MKRPTRKRSVDREAFLLSVTLHDVDDYSRYPFSIPAIKGLRELVLDDHVTFLIGDNGSGKSTLLEAIAVAAGFNPEGGSKNFRFETRSSESELHRHLRPSRGLRRQRDGFFLRAESYFNVATEIERLDRDDPGDASGPKILPTFGGVSLHEQSHGESFLALLRERLYGQGLYIFDEPEAALSPQRQLSLLTRMHQLVEDGSQFIIATHSPILMAYPGALLYQLDETGLRTVEYEETEHYRLTRDFLNGRDRYFKHLFNPKDEDT
ncbi:MAG TPA: AAA family ATPase [Kofleriaceae bacterium]|jgi:predicted ATPase|nr:AAA family ATPase [Kofleriaceae bacterium]